MAKGRAVQLSLLSCNIPRDFLLVSVGNGSVVKRFGPAVRGAVRDWFEGLENRTAGTGSQCKISWFGTSSNRFIEGGYWPGENW